MHAHKLNSNDRNSIAHTYNALRKNWRWQHLELGTKTHGHSHQKKTADENKSQDYKTTIYWHIKYL